MADDSEYRFSSQEEGATSSTNKESNGTRASRSSYSEDDSEAHDSHHKKDESTKVCMTIIYLHFCFTLTKKIYNDTNLLFYCIITHFGCF